MTLIDNLKNKFLIRPAFLYVITVSIIFLLESINTASKVYIGQNVFFILNIARAYFAALICIRTKEFYIKEDNCKLVRNAFIIFGILSFVCFADCLVSAFSTIFSFYGFAEYYFIVVIIEHLLFFIGVLFLLFYKNSQAEVCIWIFIHVIQLIVFVGMNMVYFGNNYQSDKQKWFIYFVSSCVMVLLIHLFYSYDLENTYLPMDKEKK
jgi:hypothetical protein